MSKQIPVVGKGYTNGFFVVDFQDELQWDSFIEISDYHTAMYAIQLDDDGLSAMGINAGDYLLSPNCINSAPTGHALQTLDFSLRSLTISPSSSYTFSLLLVHSPFSN